MHFGMFLFQWDAQKQDFNIKKHGVSFEEAITVFFESHSIEYFDNRHSQSEDRFWILGESNLGRILLVVYTFRRSFHAKKTYYYFRIISARIANEKEIEL